MFSNLPKMVHSKYCSICIKDKLILPYNAFCRGLLFNSFRNLFEEAVPTKLPDSGGVSERFTETTDKV